MISQMLKKRLRPAWAALQELLRLFLQGREICVSHAGKGYPPAPAVSRMLPDVCLCSGILAPFCQSIKNHPAFYLPFW